MHYATYNDTDNQSNDDLAGKKVSQAFIFSQNFYSLKQATLRAGFFLRKHENDDFTVTGDGKTLYEGSLCFYDYFLEQDADFVTKYDMIRFCNEKTGKDLVIEDIDGKYMCYEW